jgi:hypothetical protein
MIACIIYTSSTQNALYNSLNEGSGQLKPATSHTVWFHTVFLNTTLAELIFKGNCPESQEQADGGFSCNKVSTAASKHLTNTCSYSLNLLIVSRLN